MTRIEYLVGDDILKIIRETSYDMNRNKVDFLGPDPKLSIDIYTGLGGMMQINNGIKEMAVKSGLVINASELAIVKSDYEYTQYTVPFLANIKFHIDTEMDKGDVKEYINGYHPNSYTYKIKPADGEEVEIVAIGKKEKQQIVLDAKAELHKQIDNLINEFLKKYIA